MRTPSTSTFSFIVETTDLGSILVKILKQQETISSTLIFEDKKGLISPGKKSR